MSHNRAELPADPLTIAAYLSDLAHAGARHSTISRRCAAIGHEHKRAGHANPTAHPGVRATLSGIARTIGAAPEKKTALTADLLAQVLRRIPKDLTGLRDRALLLIGFAGALRRSELAALDVADVGRHPKGIVLTLRRSKTDQAGAGTRKAIPHGRHLKPVAALDAWLGAAQITEGPLFRALAAARVKPHRLCDKQISRIVKQRAAAAGLDPKLFAGHSLRSGYITSAGDSGADLARTADHAGHARLDTTRGYIQVADAFRHHSGQGFL